MSKGSQITLAAEPNWPHQQICEHSQCNTQHLVFFNFFIKQDKTGLLLYSYCSFANAGFATSM